MAYPTSWAEMFLPSDGFGDFANNGKEDGRVCPSGIAMTVKFQYKAVDASGAGSSGQIVAADRQAAIMQLQQKGQFALSLELAGADTNPAGPVADNVGRISGRELVAFTSQLHTALKSGLPLLQCLEVITAQAARATQRQFLQQLSSEIATGKSFSQALERHPGSFNALYLAMVRVGQTAGILVQTTGQLAGLLKREDQIKASIKSALVYPLCVLGMGILSVIVLIKLVMPRIIESITDANSLLPWPTQLLMSISYFIGSIYGLLTLIMLVVGVLAFWHWKRSQAGRVRWDAFKLKLPLLGPVIRAIAVGRFTRTLGSLTQAGITILDALLVVRDTLGNEALALELDEVANKVRTGSSLAGALEQSGMFGALLVQIVAVGEQTGRLDEMLLEAAGTFDQQADESINRFTVFLPVALVLVLAVIVVFIVAATLLPIVAIEFGGGL